MIDAGLNVTRGRPLDGDGVLLRCLPWLTAGLLACTFLPLLSDWPSTGDVIALSLVPVIVGTALFLPWERLPTWMQAIPPVLPFAMVALVRASHESVTAAYTPVVLLPVIWFALYGTRKQLLISVLGLGIALAVPSPPSPAIRLSSRWRRSSGWRSPGSPASRSTPWCFSAKGCRRSSA